MTKATKDEATPAVGETVSRADLEKMDHDTLILFGRLQYDLQLNKKQNPKAECVDLLMSAARKYKGNAGMRVMKEEDKTACPPDHVKVRVSAGKYNPNQRPIIVGLNFEMASIPCNKDIIMHKKWLTCLQDAVRTNYFVDKSGPEETLGYQMEHQYPFSVLDRGPETY
jgi:hypothetical protein